MTDATMVQVMHFFDMRPAEFKHEWGQLTDTDKVALKTGIGNDTLTY